MRRTTLIAMLAATAVALLWSLSSGAQALDPDACEKGCVLDKSECVSACADEDEPVECEARCADEYEDCMSECD